MPRSRILQPGISRTFSQYFEMPFTIEDILAEFDCMIVRQPIDLPQSNLSFNLEPLDRELNRNHNRIELVNETARREALISPILFEVAELTNQRINVEYSIAVNEHLRGTVGDANWSRLGRFSHSKCRLLARNTGLVISGTLSTTQLPSYPPATKPDAGYGRSTSEV